MLRCLGEPVRLELVVETLPIWNSGSILSTDGLFLDLDLCILYNYILNVRTLLLLDLYVLLTTPLILFILFTKRYIIIHSVNIYKHCIQISYIPPIKNN